MIIRAEKKGNYTILPNEFLLDDTISDKARGVLARLLCRPDNWNLNINHLIKTGKTGQVAIRSAIKELEDAGYIEKTVARDKKNGRIKGVEYVIRERKGEPEHHAAVHVQETHDDGVRIEETPNKGTSPIINTDTKQILKETTTTPVTVICNQAPPLSSSSCSSQILNMIPEKHQSPVVLTLVNKAMVDYPENEIKQALAYAGANVRGGSLQFKAYLDKTLKNGWAEGWAPEQHHDSETSKRHEAGRSWIQSLDLQSLKKLAAGSNLAALEELKRREMVH